jgi:OmpA-OmpF porin, OOP family
MKNNSLIKVFCIFSLLFSSYLAANDNDIKGSKDHPLLSRYPDTHIIEYKTSEYDEGEIRIGKSIQTNDDPSGFKHPSKRLEGKITVIEYQSNSNSPFIQIYRNFFDGLKKAGFSEIFTCVGQDNCGPIFATHVINQNPLHSSFSSYPQNTDSSNGSRFAYWAGTLHRNTGDVTVSVLVGEDGTYHEKIDIIADIIEAKAMENNLVIVDPRFLSDMLTRSGKVVLDGIFFDNDRATIKNESSTALKAIADYLNKNSSAKVFIVGHTDSSGDYKHNIDLSTQRAAAVVDSLVTNFKVDKKRLSAIGIGPVSPIESNATEDGKAKNRRVEMVLN